MISFEHVSFHYPSGTQALDDVCLHVGEGEFTCILGGNGSGKSTLAKHINALLAPSQGTVRVCGLDASDPECIYAIREKAGMVFQNPEDQLVATPVENEVAFGPENLGLPAEEIRERVSWALRSVGLEGFERRETASLSGGQKQRLAVAGALAMHPKILILDEASSMLDPKGRRDLMDVCLRLRESGMTIVMVTHSMEEAACADRIVVMDKGRIALQGTPERILSDEAALKGLSLEAPFALRLSKALAKRGVEAGPHIETDSLLARLAMLKEEACSR